MKYSYVVTGSDPFPIDMLRYDRAYPATTTDAALVDTTVGRRHQVRIRLVGDSKPTADRWSTFGWSVSDVLRT